MGKDKEHGDDWNFTCFCLKDLIRPCSYIIESKGEYEPIKGSKPKKSDT